MRRYRDLDFLGKFVDQHHRQRDSQSDDLGGADIDTSGKMAALLWVSDLRKLTLLGAVKSVLRADVHALSAFGAFLVSHWGRGPSKDPGCRGSGGAGLLVHRIPIGQIELKVSKHGVRAKKRAKKGFTVLGTMSKRVRNTSFIMNPV